MELNIQTTKGSVAGFRDNGLRKWFGIPFAKPPVGELRFRRAQACDAWSEALPCRTFGPAPIQFNGALPADGPNNGVPFSEDCLYLNIWAPEDAANCPVFVYIYGGAFSTGQASLPDFDLSAFAQDGIVGVTFNYRLGPLGFYDFSMLDPSFESNCGVSDMIAALAWVQENIAAFGGDPDKVTICGQSAGGTGVFALMSAPSAKGYFRHAITMSGLAGNVTGVFTNEINSKLFFDAIGLEPVYVSELKHMPIGMLVRGGSAVMRGFNVLCPGINISGPVIDDLVPDYTWNMLRQGSAAGIKCLMGTCENDGGLIYVDKLTLQSWAQIKTCLQLNDLTGLYPEFQKIYGGMDEEHAVMSWTTDRQFWVGTIRCALAQSEYADVYKYRFDFAPKEGPFAYLGATHCADISPALDTYAGFCELFYKDTPMPEQQTLHKYMHGAFVNFVKTGSPGQALGVQWEPFTPDRRFAASVDLTCKPLLDPNRSHYDLWEPIHLYEPDYIAASKQR